MVNIFNSLLSYLALFLVIVVVGGVAIFAGIMLRKLKNKKDAEAAAIAAQEALAANTADETANESETVNE